jgi:hypothetical protein
LADTENRPLGLGGQRLDKATVICLAALFAQPGAEHRRGEQTVWLDQTLAQAVELADELSVGLQHLRQRLADRGFGGAHDWSAPQALEV